MAHFIGEFFIRARQTLKTSLEIYQEAPSSIKNTLWVGIGCFSGYFFALYNRNELKVPFLTPPPDHMKEQKVYFITSYRVDDKAIEAFEKDWNQLAKRTLKSHGYFFTQLYKSPSTTPTPFNYLQLILWRNPESYGMWKKDKLNNQFLNSLKEKSELMKTMEYTTVFDDSIVRMIPP